MFYIAESADVKFDAAQLGKTIFKVTIASSDVAAAHLLLKDSIAEKTALHLRGKSNLRPELEVEATNIQNIGRY